MREDQDGWGSPMKWESKSNCTRRQQQSDISNDIESSRNACRKSKNCCRVLTEDRNNTPEGEKKTLLKKNWNRRGANSLMVC